MSGQLASLSSPWKTGMEQIASTAVARGGPAHERHLAVHPAHVLAEEALVADARAGLTPAQMVERKLASLLRSQPLPVSHMMTARRTSRSR